MVPITPRTSGIRTPMDFGLRTPFPTGSANKSWTETIVLDAVLRHITSPMHPWGSETPVALEIRLTKAKLW